MSRPDTDTTGATRAAAPRKRRPWWLWALLALLALALLLLGWPMWKRRRPEQHRHRLLRFE